ILGQGVEDSKRAVSWMRHTLRGNRIAPPGPCEQGAGQPPVLLIHGYLGTRGSLHLLESRLTQRGHLVLTYRLGLLHTGDICESAALIARKIESIAAQTPLHRVDIVGHSMGGLVGLYYLKRLGGRRRVRRLVMLGTPTSGTWSALFGVAMAPFGRASLQLLPDSAFLRALEQGSLPEGVEVISVVGERDRLAPSVSTHLDGVRHISVSTNHAGLLVDAKVAQLVGEILSTPSPTNSRIHDPAAH
ncbi:MAG TPA: alpha/beta fold hydrolase, partial [Polyangia bacterium]